MSHNIAVAVMPQRTVRSVAIVVGLVFAFLASALLGFGAPTRAASTPGPEATPTTSNDAPAKLKAVIIVGPTHELTASNLSNAEALAKVAESYGMDVRRVFHPKATWENVLANVQGANFVAYMGHGYGWPSPYTAGMVESRQNGMGLNPFEGATKSDVKYYGAKLIRANIVLAKNSLVFLNHLCYASGNGESFQPIPGWDLARERVDNFAAGFQAAGAKAVIAYSWQSGTDLLKMLHTTDKTFEQIFSTDSFIGTDARKFDSVRTPGTINYLDKHATRGFQRAASGDLGVTASQWANGGGVTDPTPTPTPTPPPVNVDTTSPTVPQNLSATSLGYRRVAVAWTASTDNIPGAIAYKVYRSGLLVATVATHDFVDRPDAAGTYKYKVQAVDAAGNASARTTGVDVDAVKGEVVSGTPGVSPDVTAPSVPQSLTAKARAYRYVDLTWKASTDASGDPLKYKVLRNGSVLAKVTGTSFTDRPATVGEYKYKVQAINASGNKSAFSAPVKVTAVKAL